MPTLTTSASTAPQPPWLFVQSTGMLYRPDGSLCSACYSGHGVGINNPALQNVKNIGPLPCGIYSIGKVDEEKGPLTIHLNPDAGNEMFNRNGFLIHGDNHFANHTGSEGCIVAPPAARAEVAATGGTLKVIANPVPQEIVT